MASPDDEALQERLKSALWYSVGKIVDEETLKLGVNATPQFIGALTEMVWAQIGTPVRQPGRVLTPTLTYIAAARVRESGFGVLCEVRLHAGRGTVVVDDVMLLSRRNEGLETVLKAFLDDNLGVGKRKTVAKP
ncbi:hypothetical protein MMC27_007162 [Xylographa pallens]|nr:hypothetical protein [Xylographa pallens]